MYNRKPSRLVAGLVTVGIALSVATLAPSASAAKKKATKKAATTVATTPPTTAKPAAAAATKDIVDTAVGAGTFKTLVTAVQAGGLVDTLKGAGPFTVFAPTDAAFDKVPKAILDTVLADKKRLVDILTYHVIAGKVTAADVVKLDGKTAKTVNGAELKINVKDGKVILNDTVMVTTTDIMATNGVIHVIDAVLLPPVDAAPAAGATTTTAATPAAAGLKDIVDTAAGAGSFKTLLAAATAAGLVDTLKSAGPFTVFAPTDEAFAKIPKATLDGILADKKQLTAILTYHVVAGKVLAADVVKLDGKSAKTVNGADVSIAVKDGKVTLNGNVNVLKTDVLASNGVIHVIDSVLLPPAAGAAPAAAPAAGTIIDVATKNGSFKTLLAAVDAAGLTSTLQGAGPFTVFAPTDQAFNVLPKETVAAVLKDKKLLTEILTYHVLAGRVTAANVIAKHDFKTLNGKSLTVRLANGLVYIGGAQILITDVPASNGIIHVIDTVLIP
jgi:transforming growth factor-beta-induced protein